MSARDANGVEFAEGDFALHTNNELDARPVVKVGQANMIEIAIGDSVILVPAENYIRQPPVKP